MALWLYDQVTLPLKVGDYFYFTFHTQILSPQFQFVDLIGRALTTANQSHPGVSPDPQEASKAQAGLDELNVSSGLENVHPQSNCQHEGMCW